MKKAIFIILCCMVGSVKTQAQTFCEVDSVYTNFYKETGYKIIQTQDSNFVSAGFAGLNGHTTTNWPQLILTKIDACGKVIWRRQYDSLTTCESCVGISGVWEQNDKSIVFSSYYVGVKSYVKLYKINASGQLLWEAVVGGNNKQYVPAKCVQVNTNKYLYVGSYPYVTNGKGFAIIADTLGNILHQDSFEIKTGIFDVCKRQDSTFLMLALKRGPSQTSRDDDSLWVIHSDTNLNILGIFKTVYKKNIKNTYYYSYLINYNGTELLLQATNENSDTLTLARLNLQGTIIKDTIYTGKYLYNSSVNSLEHNNYILVGYPNKIIDSSLCMVWQEDTAFSKIRGTYCAILTTDSFIISVGHGQYRHVGIGNDVADYWFGKESISISTIKAILISGNGFINQNKGTLQLYASVLPVTATNKIISWGISDTNMASITQTGLVTAKANGVVTVMATSTDGSNITTAKNITITNQGVGIADNEFMNNDIAVYPNPFKEEITVEYKNREINNVTMYDLTGKQLNQIKYSNHSLHHYIIDTHFLQSGCYILLIETDKGIYRQKLILTK